jgi:HEAT repeat protein
MKIVDRLDGRNATATFDLLVRRGGSKCAPAVESGLSSKNSLIVIAALDAAGKLRLASVVPRCKRLASGSERDLSKAAIECLSRINDPESVGFLVDLLESSRDPERTDALAVALRRMTGRLHGTDVAKWRAYLAKRNR